MRDWMLAQPGVAEELETLVCDGKTLRGSIVENKTGAARFMDQVSLYSQTLGVAMAQATDASGEIQALPQLLDAVQLEGMSIQANALHANRHFPLLRPARRRGPDCHQK